MTIIDVCFSFEVEHRPKGSRKSFLSQVSDVTSIEVAELTSEDTPVALIRHGNKKERSVWRDVGGRLFRPQEGTYRQAKPLDLKSFRELALSPLNDDTQHRVISNPWRDSPFEPEGYTTINHWDWKTPTCRAMPSVEFHLDRRSDNREEALARIAEYARNVVLIDGAVWRVSREPLIGANRTAHLMSAELFTTTPEEAGRENVEVMVHAFRVDRGTEAAAFHNDILADSERLGPMRRELRHCWDGDLATSDAAPRYEVMRPEVLNFDESAHCERLLFSTLPRLIEKGPIGELWSLPTEALQAWLDLRKYSELGSGPGRLYAGREALDRFIAALPDAFPGYRNSTLNLVSTYACDLADRIDLLRSYTPSPDINDGLNSLRA